MMVALQAAQRHRKRTLLAVILLAACLVTVTAEPTKADALWATFWNVTGTLLVAVSVVGRAWCAAVLGRRKKVALVTGGPFSISRNPLYLFTVVGAFGVGLTTESVFIACLFAGLVFIVHDRVVRQEEMFLRDRFGDAFDAYCQETPRWFSLRAFRRPDAQIGKPDLELVFRRGAETALLFVAIPILDGIEYLQNTDVLPVFVYLH